MCHFFFFKQKTAYEMRISDWSSDVCSSDLLMPIVKLGGEGRWTNYHGTGTCEAATRFALRSGDAEHGRDEIAIAAKSVQDWLAQAKTAQRRVRPLGAGWSPSNVNIA